MKLNNFDRLIFPLAALVMLATRSQHLANVTHLPDASWAVFFLAGWKLRRLWMLPGLLLLAALSDWLAIKGFSGDAGCITPAYAGLLPAYVLLWLAGHRYGLQYPPVSDKPFAFRAVLSFFGHLGVGALLAFLVSSGSYWLYSDAVTYPGVNWSTAAFWAQQADFFMKDVHGLLFYVAAACLLQWLFLPNQTSERGVGFHANS